MTERKKRHPDGTYLPHHAQDLTERYSDKKHTLRQFECVSCKKLRPLQDFFESQPSYDPRDRPAMCNLCGRRGRNLPDIVNEADTLTVAHRKAMRVMLSPAGNSDKEAAAASGLSVRKCGDLRSGRVTPEFRRTLQVWMHSEGLTPEYLVDELKEAIKSTRKQWNPEAKCWDEAPDNGVRFQAVRHAMKLLEFEAPREAPGSSLGINLIILDTNLGKDEGSVDSPPGTYTITAEEKGSS